MMHIISNYKKDMMGVQVEPLNHCADCGMSMDEMQQNKECLGYTHLRGIMYYHEWTGKSTGTAYANSVKNAIIRDNKITVEWDGDFGNGYLEMTTADPSHFYYEGIYTEGEFKGKVQGKLYTADNNYLLNLDYQDNAGSRGVWFIELNKVKYNG